MLRPATSRRLDSPITVSLKDFMPADHFCRHLEAKLDLAFVRDWTRGLFARRGRPSIDLDVFFKLQLVMFFAGIRAERKLIETASRTLAQHWYLGYAFDKERPEHSSPTRIRQRLSLDLFQRFFEPVPPHTGACWRKDGSIRAVRQPGLRADERVSSEHH